MLKEYWKIAQGQVSFTSAHMKGWDYFFKWNSEILIEIFQEFALRNVSAKTQSLVSVFPTGDYKWFVTFYGWENQTRSASINIGFSVKSPNRDTFGWTSWLHTRVCNDSSKQFPFILRNIWVRSFIRWNSCKQMSCSSITATFGFWLKHEIFNYFLRLLFRLSNEFLDIVISLSLYLRIIAQEPEASLCRIKCGTQHLGIDTFTRSIRALRDFHTINMIDSWIQNASHNFFPSNWLIKYSNIYHTQ